MTDDSASAGRTVSRRTFLAGSSALALTATAGCLAGGSSGGSGGDPLEAGGSSTVYPIASKASSYWNANRPASDTEYWPHSKYGIDTEKNLADYWGSLYGFETESDGPPFRTSVALSHSGTGVEKCYNGQVDIGNSSGNVAAEKPDWPQSRLEKFVDHVVAVDGQPLVVSQEIHDAGVTGITGQELKDLYKGRITNWKALGGPDREVQVLGRVKGSGTRTAFVSNVFGDPTADTQVANRYGQNQRLAQAVAQANNAISYLALAFLDTDGIAPISLTWKGTTYAYKDPQHGLDSKAYPLSRDLHMYTYDGTSKKEAAFLRMILHPFGQATFVEPNDYFTLSDRRRKEQLGKLPDTV